MTVCTEDADQLLDIFQPSQIKCRQCGHDKILLVGYETATCDKQPDHHSSTCQHTNMQGNDLHLCGVERWTRAWQSRGSTNRAEMLLLCMETAVNSMITSSRHHENTCKCICTKLHRLLQQHVQPHHSYTSSPSTVGARCSCTSHCMQKKVGSNIKHWSTMILYWLPVPQRLDYKICNFVHIYRHLHSSAPLPCALPSALYSLIIGICVLRSSASG